MRQFFIFLYVFFGATCVHAQMTSGIDTLYGNEWLNYSQTYYKIPISADRMYRLTGANLRAAGIPLSTLTGQQFQVFRAGKEVPLFVTTAGALSDADYIEFYGRYNRSEIDSFMFRGGYKNLLNPEYNVCSDTAAYFLTWTTTGTPLRYAGVANNLTNLPAKEPWFWYDLKQVFSNGLLKSEIGNGVYLPEYGASYPSSFINYAEGFAALYSKDRTVSMNPPFLQAGQEGRLSLRYAGDLGGHNTTIAVNGVTEILDFYNTNNPINQNFNLRDTFVVLPSTKMANTMSVRITGSFDANDFHALAVINLRYARQFNFGNQNFFEFDMPASTTVKYLEIANVNTGGVAPILYDLTNNTRLVTTLEGGLVKIALPPSVSDRKLVLTAANASTNLASTALRPMNFDNLRTDGGDYIIITNAKYFNDGNGNNRVQEYANYRSSAEGGGYRVKIVDVQQLYDQFGYGINRHPLSIRNFVAYIKKNWQNPRFLVLIGKARQYGLYRTAAQIQADPGFDVPTWGHPGSDPLLAVTEANTWAPSIPIGRIAIKNANELKNYLDKIKENDLGRRTAAQTVEDRGWRKRIMHLSGGGNEGGIIKSYLNTGANILQNSQWGAATTTFVKNNIDPVQASQNELIYNAINQGTPLITFFGHSAVGILDFDINNPDFLNNRGKYPVFVALGCAAGNVHLASGGVSEDFVFYKDKGMIAFLGTVGSSYLDALNRFLNEYYNVIGNTRYKRTIGEISQTTVRNLSSTTSLGLISVLQEYLINGDPAITISDEPGPDYLVDARSVQIQPTTLTAQLDSFNIKANVVNLGSSATDSIRIDVKQVLPNGKTVDLWINKIPAPRHSTALNLTVPMLRGESVAGANRLLIRVDATNAVSELPSPSAEANNDLTSAGGDLGLPFFIFDNTVRPIYPTEFGIAGAPSLTLKASSSNALAPEQKYIFEIDTVATFSSPFKQRHTTTQKGGIVRWQPNLNWRDSTVYFWRTSVDSVSPQLPYVWTSSSFTYISGIENGWGQSNIEQFRQNTFSRLILEDDIFKFGQDAKVVDIKPNFPEPNTNPLYTVNGSIGGFYMGYPRTALCVAVFDSVKADLWINYPVGAGPYQYSIPHPLGYFVRTFIFDPNDTSSTRGRRGFMNFIENVVPRNNYVMFFTAQFAASDSYNPQTWAADSISFGKNIFSVLEKQGATQVRNLASTGSVPYLFVFQKDRANVVAEKVSGSWAEGIRGNFTVYGRLGEGSMDSKIIGPATSWSSLNLNYAKSAINPQSDTIAVEVTGLDSTQRVATTLMQGIRPPSVSLENIDARRYPYLRLRFYTRDNDNRTASQLLSWRVYYQGVPDLAVNPNVYYRKYNDTLEQGDAFKMEVAVENVSNTNADSVLVKLTLKDANNTERSKEATFAPLPKNQQFTARFDYDTKDIAAGVNLVTLEVNPKQKQPETVLFNNVIQSDFFVEKDKRNPLLEVTFDGLRILNNDIVSAKPRINIELRDENKFLALNDTALFRLFLETPSGVRRPIFLTDPQVRFVPAVAGINKENKAQIEMQPTFTEEGTYRLIVKAKDATGNAAGAIDYSVAFQVITKSALSNVLNYPNPFSTQTRFVYTLTGDEIPTVFKIQIMTVSGKVVREITQDEIGTLRIGTHLTDYVWDGSDEFGNKLANGVYLYRVVAKKADGKTFDMHDNGTDGLFKNGLGKLVIMR